MNYQPLNLVRKLIEKYSEFLVAIVVVFEEKGILTLLELLITILIRNVILVGIIALVFYFDTRNMMKYIIVPFGYYAFVFVMGLEYGPRGILYGGIIATLIMFLFGRLVYS